MENMPVLRSTRLILFRCLLRLLQRAQTSAFGLVYIAAKTTTSGCEGMKIDEVIVPENAIQSSLKH
jgi:hypothetical protein